MDFEVTQPTDFEIRQQCKPSLERLLNKATTFSGTYQPKNSQTISRSSRQRIRITGIYKESRIAGARRGAHARYRALHQLLQTKQHTGLLDRIFNFGVVMRDAKIVPPVISQVEGSVELSNDRLSARTTQRSWRIIKPARITTSKLNWRTYLDLSAMLTEQDISISAYFAPRTKSERKTWQAGYCAGFAAGYRQADRQYALQLAELKRDFIGMWRFKQLEMQGIVTSPQVIETRLGTIVNDNVVFIDERDVRISEPTKFSEQLKWRNTQIN